MLQQQPQQQHPIELTTAGSNTLQVPCKFEAWQYEFEYFFEHPEDELDEGAENGTVCSTGTETSTTATPLCLWKHSFMSIDDEDVDIKNTNARASNEQVHSIEASQEERNMEWLFDAQADMKNYRLHQPATQLQHLPHHQQQQKQQGSRTSAYNHEQEKSSRIQQEGSGSLVCTEWNSDFQHYYRAEVDRMCRYTSCDPYKAPTANIHPDWRSTPYYSATSVLETENTRQDHTVNCEQQASPQQPRLLTWQPYATFQEKPQQQPNIYSPPIGSEATTATYGYVFSDMCDAGVAPNAHVSDALVPVAPDVNHIVSDDSAAGVGGAAVVAAAGAKRHYVTPAASPKKKARTTTTGLNRIWDDPDRPKRSRSAYNYFFKHERAKMLQESKDKNGKITFACMGREIGKKWKTLDKETKVKFQKIADNDMKRYEAEKEAYLMRKQSREQGGGRATERNAVA